MIDQLIDLIHLCPFFIPIQLTDFRFQIIYPLFIDLSLWFPADLFWLAPFNPRKFPWLGWGMMAFYLFPALLA
jgi:hypothetical protein